MIACAETVNIHAHCQFMRQHVWASVDIKYNITGFMVFSSPVYIIPLAIDFTLFRTIRMAVRSRFKQVIV